MGEGQSERGSEGGRGERDRGIEGDNILLVSPPQLVNHTTAYKRRKCVTPTAHT